MRGGYYCAVKSCSNSSQLRLDGTSFFSFPKDPERSKLWLEAIKRDDLTNSTTEKLHKNYRICGLHFSQRMFKNDLRNRLFDHAYPDINCGAESEESTNMDYITIIDLRDTSVLPQFLQCDTDTHTEFEAVNDNENSNLTVHERDIDSTEPMSIEVTVISDSDLNDKGGTLQFEESISEAEDRVPTTEHFVDSMSPNIRFNDTLNSSNVAGTSVSCQTNPKLSNNSPRKQQLKTKVKLLQRKVRNLEEKLIKSQLAHQEEQCISLEKYFQYTDKLLPQKVADFVKAQVRLFQQSKNGRKYSKEFKQDCLNMFLNGPKAYKSLSETFALPTPRCLQRCVQQPQTTEALDDFDIE